MHHPLAWGEGDKNFRKVFAGGDKKNLFFRWGYIVVCVGEGGGLREGGKGLSKFEVNLKLLNTSIKSIFGITYST